MKLLFLLAAITVGINSYSQIYKFRSFKTGYVTDKKTEIEWEINKVLITFDTDKNEMITHGESESRYHLRSKEKIEDEDGDTRLIYKATDEKGNICRITFYIYKNQESYHFGTIKIEYDASTLYFQVKKEKTTSIEN